MVYRQSSHSSHQGSRPTTRLDVFSCFRGIAVPFCRKNWATFIVCLIKRFIVDFDWVFQAQRDSSPAAIDLIVCYLQSWFFLRRVTHVFNFCDIHQGLLSFCQALQLTVDSRWAQLDLSDWWRFFDFKLTPKNDWFEKEFFTPLVGSILQSAMVSVGHFSVFGALYLWAPVAPLG